MTRADDRAKLEKMAEAWEELAREQSRSPKKLDAGRDPRLSQAVRRWTEAASPSLPQNPIGAVNHHHGKNERHCDQDFGGLHCAPPHFLSCSASCFGFTKCTLPQA